MLKDEIVEETTDNSEFTTEAEVEETSEADVDYTTESEADDSAEVEESEFVQKEEDDDKDDSSDEANDDDDSESDDDSDDDDDKKPGKNHSLEEIENLNETIQALRAEVEELRAFKLAKENQQKDAIINQYFMLSDSDKEDVIAHKAEYSIEEIESKLALIYVKKNVDFSALLEESENPGETVEEDPITSFSLDDEDAGFVSPIQEALRRTVR